MPHVKIYLFFLLLILPFIHSLAQTDSGSLQKGQDTGVLQSRTPHPVSHTKRSDSAFSRKGSGSDSSARRSARLQSPAHDGLPRPSGPAASSPVSFAGSHSGADSFSLFRQVMRINPYFNFAGKAFVEKLERHEPDSKDALFYLLLGILFYFALIRVFFEKYFDNLLMLFFRVSIRQQQIREQVLQTPLPSLLLNILFVISGGLYATWLVRYYHFAGNINFWILFINCMGALGLIYLGKFLLLKFCGWVFNISRATDIYIFVVFLVNKMMGIFLLPFLILLFFSGKTAGDIFVTISLSMVVIFFIYRVIASFRPIRNEIKLTPFHFFLYLCAFEIAPLLLIYKVLLSYLEKAY